MATVKSNIEELRKIINGIEFTTEDAKDEAIEFLDAVAEGVYELEETIDDLKDDCDKKDEKISNLEDDLNEQSFGKTIDAGIGVINYESPNNIQLQDLMENFSEQVKTKGPKKVAEILSVI